MAGKKKILIIEDEMSLVDVMRMKLRSIGYEVECANDGQSGLEKAKAGKPDLILLDIIMPGMDGYEALERLKADPETEAIPVIVLSNSGRDEEIERGRILGAVDYLIKAQLSLEEMAQKTEQVAGRP